MPKIYYCTITERISDLTVVTRDKYFNSETARNKFVSDYNQYLYKEGECFISKQGEAAFNKAGVLTAI